MHEHLLNIARTLVFLGIMGCGNIVGLIFAGMVMNRRSLLVGLIGMVGIVVLLCVGMEFIDPLLDWTHHLWEPAYS